MIDSKVQIKQASVGRLSALPCFFKSPGFWKGALDPRLSIEESARFKALREFSSSHQWGVINPAGLSSSLPSGTELTVIELGLGLLQRGAWTPCSWMVEQDIAHRMQKSGLCQFSDYPSRSGLLGFEPKEIQAERLKLTLTSGRLQSEVEPSAIDHYKIRGRVGFGQNVVWQCLGLVPGSAIP